MDEVRVKKVIVCTKKRRGDGKRSISPVRIVEEVLGLKGNLIAEDDPCGGITPETILDFLNWHYPDITKETHMEKIYAYFIEGNGSV